MLVYAWHGEQERSDLLMLRCMRRVFDEGGGVLADQADPDMKALHRIGRDLVHALRKKRFRLSGTDQLLRERPHRIGVEQRREQPVERFIVTKNQHRIQKRVS